MKIKLLTATLAAMLCLTACGETDKADTTSDKPAETTTTTAASEEVTTETTPAVETTVTTTTEVTTTTSATTTTAPAEPAKEEFKLAAGLSEKYVDFDNMAIEYNGHIFKFGEATVQDFLDAGVELFTDDDLDEDYVASYDDVEAQVKVNDTIRADLSFKPWGDSSNARDCVLWRFKINLINSPYDKVTWGTNYGEGMVHTNIPLRLKKDELIANSGEPVDMHSGSIGGSLICKYTAPSFRTPDRDDQRAEIEFTFYNGDLATIFFSAHETQY